MWLRHVFIQGIGLCWPPATVRRGTLEQVGLGSKRWDRILRFEFASAKVVGPSAVSECRHSRGKRALKRQVCDIKDPPIAFRTSPGSPHVGHCECLLGRLLVLSETKTVS